MYLIIHDVHAHNVAADNPPLAVGLPTVTAFTGFAHALELSLKKNGVDVALGGIAVVFHDHEILPGHPKFAPSGDDLKKGKEGASILDEPFCRMITTLIIEVAAGAADLNTTAGISAVERFLIGGRIAGGQIVKTGNVAVVDDITAKAVRIRGGTVLKDRVDLLVAASEAEIDPLDAVLDACESIEVEDDGKKTRKRRQSGWIVPLNVGYELIEAPTQRSTHRVPDGTYEHAYAESINSLAEFVSLPRALTDNFSGCFWKHRNNESGTLYYVSADVSHFS